MRDSSDSFDATDAQEIVLEGNPAFQREVVLIKLRRELRELCREAIANGLTNSDALTVVADIGRHAVLAAINETPQRLVEAKQALGHQLTSNSEVRRFCLLASDAFGEADDAITAISRAHNIHRVATKKSEPA